jgi:hypothetical protein
MASTMSPGQVSLFRDLGAADRESSKSNGVGNEQRGARRLAEERVEERQRGDPEDDQEIGRVLFLNDIGSRDCHTSSSRCA